jgi:transcriptional regulator with XRE-family HTH domain
MKNKRTQEEELEFAKMLLFENYARDQTKMELNNIQRALLLDEYRRKTGISGRELGRRLGLSHSVIQDWLRWIKIEPKTYLSLKNDGLSDTAIYRMLRNGDDSPTAHLLTQLDITFRRLTETSSSIQYADENALTLIKKISNESRRLELKIERKLQGRG